MPKIPNQRKPLTVNQLRVLSALVNNGGGATRTRLGNPSGDDLMLLSGAGYLRAEEIDLDGAKERLYVATDAGRDAAGRMAGVSGKNGKARPPGALEQLAIGALVPWFGSARRQAEQIGEAFRGVAWVGVPFCGSLCEIPAMLGAGVNAINANDAHGHLINLARVAADPRLGASLIRRLRRMPFCTKTLESAQRHCEANEPIACRTDNGIDLDDGMDLECAVNYFISAWMSRSAEAGKTREFDAGLAIRWGAGGGNSVLRYANAVGGMRSWGKILSRCALTVDDAFDFLERCNDRVDGGIYADPPWPGPGDAYMVKFSQREQKRLAAALNGFVKARVVVRSGGDALMRTLYLAKDGWDWKELHGRNQANRESSEWIAVKRGR